MNRRDEGRANAALAPPFSLAHEELSINVRIQKEEGGQPKRKKGSANKAERFDFWKVDAQMGFPLPS